jgi:hypothetical protein
MMTPPFPDAELAAAAREFAGVWAELGPCLPDDYACHMTCAEADTLCELLRAAGHRAAGDSVLAAHAAHDEPGDGHYPHKWRSSSPACAACSVCGVAFDNATGVCPGPPG